MSYMAVSWSWKPDWGNEGMKKGQRLRHAYSGGAVLALVVGMNYTTTGSSVCLLPKAQEGRFSLTRRPR